MPVTGRVEIERRIRAVQEWVLSDYTTLDIVGSCTAKWGVSERQAKRYIKTASERFKHEEDKKLSIKRAQRVQKLKRMAKSMDPKYANTPAGISALLRIEKEIIKLEGVIPTKQMIEAEIAKDADLPVDPLSPTTNILTIEALLPHGHTPVINTANT